MQKTQNVSSSYWMDKAMLRQILLLVVLLTLVGGCWLIGDNYDQAIETCMKKGYTLNECTDKLQRESM